MRFAPNFTCAAWIIAIALIWSSAALAGAWTLPAGDTQIISGVILSSADEMFDDSGHGTPTLFRKILVQSYAEHGLTDDLTLILEPEYAIATVGSPNEATTHANDFAIKAGARALLTNAFGVLSAEASYKSAGAFDMSVSAHHDSGQEIEFRLLYGTNFTFLHREGYFDAEIAERIIGGARPNETPIDLALGLKITKSVTIIGQSFNIISGGDAHPPFGYYRSHKLELGVLQRLWRSVYLESGAYISPTGQNSLVEHGAEASLWVRF